MSPSLAGQRPHEVHMKEVVELQPGNTTTIVLSLRTSFLMEGSQGHFPTGTLFLEVKVQDGRQATPKHWMIITVSN